MLGAAGASVLGIVATILPALNFGPLYWMLNQVPGNPIEFPESANLFWSEFNIMTTFIVVGLFLAAIVTTVASFARKDPALLRSAATSGLAAGAFGAFTVFRELSNINEIRPLLEMVDGGIGPAFIVLAIASIIAALLSLGAFVMIARTTPKTAGA